MTTMFVLWIMTVPAVLGTYYYGPGPDQCIVGCDQSQNDAEYADAVASARAMCEAERQRLHSIRGFGLDNLVCVRSGPLP